MRTVWKVQLTPEMNTVDLVQAAKPLCVQMQHDIPCMWVEVDSEMPHREYSIAIIGTGHPIPPGRWSYVGTFQFPAESLVFHVYLGE